MIVCPRCEYTQGWKAKGADDNEYIEGGKGDFYEVKEFISVITAKRFHGDKCERHIHGCPSCMSIFMGDVKETYVSTNGS